MKLNIRLVLFIKIKINIFKIDLMYRSLSFVKFDSEKWVQIILDLLRLIFEANISIEVDIKLKTLLNWSAKVDQHEEETKLNSAFLVPDNIYGKELDLCKIPTQNLSKIEDLEKRVQNLAKTAIAYQKVRALYLN